MGTHLNCIDLRICCGYSFELHRLVDAIQMSTHNICIYKVDKKYTGCNLKIMELLDCALIGVCAIIRLKTVCCGYSLEAPQKQNTCYGYSFEVPQCVLSGALIATHTCWVCIRIVD